MAKEDKFEIGLTLNKIAMLLSDEDFHKVKDLLKHVEQIVAKQTESTGSPIGDYRDGVGAWQTDCPWK